MRLFSLEKGNIQRDFSDLPVLTGRMGRDSVSESVVIRQEIMVIN